MERLRGKCAMLGLLDRATKLTSSPGEKPGLTLQALPTPSQPKTPAGLRAESNLLNRIRLMLAVQFCLQKYFPSPPTQIKSIFAPSRSTEGRIAIVTDAERDAVDADGASDEGA